MKQRYLPSRSSRMGRGRPYFVPEPPHGHAITATAATRQVASR
jgi:hypothetical protein